MKKIEYSPLVNNKLNKLKNWLIEHFSDEKTIEIITAIISDAERLAQHEKSGINISEMYDIDTNYWYIFTHQHYLIYRIETDRIIIVQMFHEREDFMKSLFGMSGRTQESIDYWGE
ncbi:MAG: type II toxin-antitoxin system RelE/ParE family toxin [Lachnospiraceae bacterium]|nr:type II toxin-antitoxin system RelE/ParE family toxin [Lachnospiraceae bacterium]